jgi:deaminated glutathione amidase
MFLAAAVQLSSSSNEAGCLADAEALIARAARSGAQLIVTPENTNFLGPHTEKVRRAEPLDGPTASRFSSWASKHQIHLLIGSFNEKSHDPERCYNTSLLFGPDGSLLKHYRKIHLFDVDVSADVRFLESETIIPGADIAVARTALGTIGMSICYDLRFPELYRKLVEAGAEIIAIPSAFTLTTGKDHWHTLIRARAIECQAYVIAPGQYGLHDDKGLRQSYGHSMIVDPWGHIIGMSPDGLGLALAEIDLDLVAKTRRGMPVTEHRVLV